MQTWEPGVYKVYGRARESITIEVGEQKANISKKMLKRVAPDAKELKIEIDGLKGIVRRNDIVEVELSADRPVKQVNAYTWSGEIRLGVIATDETIIDGEHITEIFKHIPKFSVNGETRYYYDGKYSGTCIIKPLSEKRYKVVCQSTGLEARTMKEDDARKYLMEKIDKEIAEVKKHIREYSEKVKQGETSLADTILDYKKRLEKLESCKQKKKATDMAVCYYKEYMLGMKKDDIAYRSSFAEKIWIIE